MLKKRWHFPEARAALAGSLLESLDDAVDASAEEEWNEEITRRIRDLGKVKWAEARQISAIIKWALQVVAEAPLDSVPLFKLGPQTKDLKIPGIFGRSALRIGNDVIKV